MRATALALRRPDLQTLLSELAGAHWPEVTEVRLAMVAPLLYRLRRFSAAHAADPDHPIAHARAGRLGGGRAAPTGRLGSTVQELNVEVSSSTATRGAHSPAASTRAACWWCSTRSTCSPITVLTSPAPRSNGKAVRRVEQVAADEFTAVSAAETEAPPNLPCAHNIDWTGNCRACTHTPEPRLPPLMIIKSRFPTTDNRSNAQIRVGYSM